MMIIYMPNFYFKDISVYFMVRFGNLKCIEKIKLSLTKLTIKFNLYFPNLLMKCNCIKNKAKSMVK